MRIVETFRDTRLLAGGRVGLVPTMGFLHEGHLSLADAARGSSDTVVMSLFVNPLQFDEQHDLDRYPRELERDAALAEARGVDVLFAPPVEEMYPRPPLSRVHVAEVTDHMEGAYRPGHFDGVATVVAKLFAGLRPDAAYFGRKDAQQLVVVRSMSGDLSFPVDVAGLPIVRERDGLALSSRNVFLSPAARAVAIGLSIGLMAAADAIAAGERSARTLENIVSDHLGGFDSVDYVTLADQRRAQPVPVLDQPCFLAVAARVGGTRLIDNIHADASGEVDRGRRLSHESILYREG